MTLEDGQSIAGDYLVMAGGSRPNFFGTPGAEHAFPLYSLDDAEKLRSRACRRSRTPTATDRSSNAAP